MLPHVRRWFDSRTSGSGDWPLHGVLAAKAGRRVSVVIPARNEQATIGAIVAAIRTHLLDQTGLVDELVVMDSRSTDATAHIAEDAGATVVAVDRVLPWLGLRDGKGEALWKSLEVTSGEVVVFLDADLENFCTSYVTGLLGPLLADPDVAFVKAAYDRSLRLGAEVQLTGGGRVTEFAARPMLNAHWPDLAGVLQPLAGEYAARRDALESVPFACGYGVEIGLLIDLLELGGLASFAQVDLGHRTHRNRNDAELVPMASAVLHTALRRLPGARPVSTTVTQFDRQGPSYVPHTIDVRDDERPAFSTVRQAQPALLVS